MCQILDFDHIPWAFSFYISPLKKINIKDKVLLCRIYKTTLDMLTFEIAAIIRIQQHFSQKYLQHRLEIFILKSLSLA